MGTLPLCMLPCFPVKIYLIMEIGTKQRQQVIIKNWKFQYLKQIRK